MKNKFVFWFLWGVKSLAVCIECCIFAIFLAGNISELVQGKGLDVEGWFVYSLHQGGVLGGIVFCSLVVLIILNYFFNTRR